jgi:serine/threonine-protein kinase
VSEPGEIVAARYRLDEVIGRGGMASVFRGWDLRLARPVAVKLLRPEILADPDLALRFRREAHAATVLRHENVVACLDTGTDGDRPYLVMDLIDGEDLAARLRRDRRLPTEIATRIARDVARGLAIAHARGIVHRDVKPGNILLATSGRAMVTDFGIARVAAEAEATLPGTTLGSVNYFSPEQARGATTTPASDVYGLGLVLFEMLTGTRAFAGETPAAIAVARIDAPAPSPRSIDPAIPAAVDAVVARALAPDPTDRYPNGAAFADALDGLLVDRTIDPAGDTQRVALPTWPGATAGLGGGAPASRTRAASGNRRPGVVTAALAAGVIVAVGAFAAFAALGGGNGVAAIDPIDVARPEVTLQPSAGATLEPPVVTPAPATPSTTPPTTPPVTAAPEPGQPADLCEPEPEASCALEAGTYRPSGFDPSFTIELGSGWSTYRHASQLVVLERDDGYLALASSVFLVFDGEETFEVRTRATDLVDAIRDNEALEILNQSRVRVAGRRAIQLDLVPAGDRAPIFAIGDDTYYAETTTVTRLLAFEVRGTAVLLVLEGAGDSDLEGFLDAAAPVVEGFDFG